METEAPPPPVLQLCFDSDHGWTVVAQRVKIVLGQDAPEDVRQDFLEQVGQEMPDDMPMGQVTLKGRRFSSQDEMVEWLTNMVPLMWEWFVGIADDVPSIIGLES
jgi:hypothetical protein